MNVNYKVHYGNKRVITLVRFISSALFSSIVFCTISFVSINIHQQQQQNAGVYVSCSVLNYRKRRWSKCEEIYVSISFWCHANVLLFQPVQTEPVDLSTKSDASSPPSITITVSVKGQFSRSIITLVLLDS